MYSNKEVQNIQIVGGSVGAAVKLYRGGLRDPGAPESYDGVYVLPITTLTGSLCRKGRYLLQVQVF